MSLDRVLSAMKLPNANTSGPLSSRYQRPAIASTRAWVYDTEKLIQTTKYAEESSKETRGASTRVLTRDNKDIKQRAKKVDSEVKTAVETTAMVSTSLEKAINAHEQELVKLLQERSHARDALALVYAPLERIRKRIEVRLANPLPVEERTDTSVLESLQIVSKSLSECSKSLVGYIKEGERHCTHMESLRQAIRSEIGDRHDTMKMTYAGAHEVPIVLPSITNRSNYTPNNNYASVTSHVFDDGTNNNSNARVGEYSMMLKSDIARCLRLSQASIAESVLLRSKISQAVKDISIVRKRNEKLLNVTLEAHVKDAEMLQRSISTRKNAVIQEIDQVKQAEEKAKKELNALKNPSQVAHEKLRQRARYAKGSRDPGRAVDSVMQATNEESVAFDGALKDAMKCENTLVRHRERLEGILGELTKAEKSKARVLEVALATMHEGGGTYDNNNNNSHHHSGRHHHGNSGSGGGLNNSSSARKSSSKKKGILKK